jgi:hypothetical protein
MAKNLRHLMSFLGVLIVTLPALAVKPAPPSDQAVKNPPIIFHDVKHGFTPRPLRELPVVEPHGNMKTFQEHETFRIHTATVFAGNDPAVQTAVLPKVAASLGLNFNGIGATDLTGGVGAPPDTNGAIGSSQYVETVNTAFAVFDKNSGNRLMAVADISTLFQSLGGTCAQTNESDPIVIFDKMAKRWLIGIINGLGGSSNDICVAVSTSSDATGTYALYDVPFGGSLPDYPKFSSWPDAFYFTANIFGNGTPRACAFDRAAMLNGQPLQMVCFDAPAANSTLLPGDMDSPNNLPPAGEPAFFIGLGGDNASLQLFKFHVDFANTANSTFNGPTTIPVAGFTELCSSSGGSCVPQLGSTQQLDSLSDRPMFRLAYRNFGDHESLVVNHSVTAGASGGVRWYEIRGPNSGSPSVFQQGTFAPDASFRWMGSVAMDQSGDMAAGYSISSSSIDPAIGITARSPSDPLGQLESENVVFRGGGSQQPTLNRWGDYSDMTVDPVDDCTFWYTTEYIPANGSFNWQTRIVNFKMPNCNNNATPDFNLSASPASVTIAVGGSGTTTIGVTDLNGFNGSVNLSASGLPSGVTASFSPNPTGTSSTLTFNASASASAGTSTVTITGTSGSLSHTTTVSLTVTAAANFSLSASPSSVSVAQGSSGSSTITVNKLNGFNSSVSLSASGLPSGVTASFNPTSTTGTSTLTLTASGTATTGTSTVTVTGTSGSLSHTVNITLTVTTSGGGGGNVQVTLPFNINSAIVTDGTTFTGGGLDNDGSSYSANLLGTSVSVGSVAFKLGGANAADAVSNTTVTLPAGQFSTLDLLATGVNGNQASQRFTVHFSDGTTQTITQSLSDWFTPQRFAGETTAATMAHRDNSNGATDNRTFLLYEYSFTLTAGKTVTSIVLPANRNVVVLAMTLVPANTPPQQPAQANLSGAFNREGIVTDGTTFSGGLDGGGSSYSSNLLGTTLTFNGASFTFGTANQNNAVSAGGQTITLPSGNFSTLRMLATGVDGNQASQTFTVTFSDGTSTSFTQSISDWFTPQSFAGESIASSMAHRDNGDGSTDARTFDLYGYSFTLNNTKTVSSITLPNNGNVEVLAITLMP